MHTSPLLSPAELADRWGWTTGHLANLRSERRGVAFVRLGGSIRYRLSDVEQFELDNVVQTLDSKRLVAA